MLRVSGPMARGCGFIYENVLPFVTPEALRLCNDIEKGALRGFVIIYGGKSDCSR